MFLGFFLGKIEGMDHLGRRQVLLGLLFVFEGVDDLLGFGIDDLVLLVDVEACGDHGDGNGFAQVRVFANPHDDVGPVAGLGLDVIVDLPDLVNGDFLGA